MYLHKYMYERARKCGDVLKRVFYSLRLVLNSTTRTYVLSWKHSFFQTSSIPLYYAPWCIIHSYILSSLLLSLNTPCYVHHCHTHHTPSPVDFLTYPNSSQDYPISQHTHPSWTVMHLQGQHKLVHLMLLMP